MKKEEATRIQNEVFRRVFSSNTRKHKRRLFLCDALVDLQFLCGFSPEQFRDIMHDIVSQKTFNPFGGYIIRGFESYCVGYRQGLNQRIDTIEIKLLRDEFSFLGLFNRRELYRISYFYQREIVASYERDARRF